MRGRNVSLLMSLDDYLQKQINTTPGNPSVENEVKIFRNAIDFKDTQICECMIPRNEIVAVEFDSVSREELVRKFIATILRRLWCIRRILTT